MKFNVDKLKQLSRPLSEKEKYEAEYRDANREWLAISEKLALKLRYILRTKGISQRELASRMGVTSAQVTKILSGKENLGLKTICKIEKAIGTNLIDISLEENVETYSVQQKTYVQVVSIPVYVKSDSVGVNIQRANSYSPFVANNILG